MKKKKRLIKLKRGENRRTNLKNVFSLFMYIIILLLAQAPVFLLEGNWCNIYKLFKYAQNETPANVLSLQIIMFGVYQVLCATYFFTVLLKKQWHLNIACIFIGLINAFIGGEGLISFAENTVAGAYFHILLLLSLLELLIPKMLSAKKEAEKEARESIQRDREYKEEKKRKLYFQGSYSKLLYYVIWKNFKYNWKDYILFVLSSIMIVTAFFVGFGNYEMMAGIHSKENFIIGSGLGTILYNAFFPIGTCSIILLSYILLTYLKKRMVSFSLFLMLGSRKKTIYMMIALELVFGSLCAVIIGSLLGNVALSLVKREVGGVLGIEISFSMITWKTYVGMLFAMLFVYFLSFLSVIEIVRDLNLMSASARSVREERLPGKGLFVFVIGGIILCVWSVLKYGEMQSNEEIRWLAIYFLGVFFIIRYGMAAYLQKSKKGKSYLPKLVSRNQLYYKSKTVVWYVVGTALISVCALFYFAFQAVSVILPEDTDALYPYDFMCITDDEDEEFFESLSDKYDIEISSYPMVRISSADGRAGIESPREHSPQGQHIGISETSYHALQKALNVNYQEHSLGLDDEGEKIHIVHQQSITEKAHPVDFEFPRKTPKLHVGLPCIYYSKTTPEYISGYLSREIKSEEIKSLTGGFRQGLQENLIVFSDSYFEKAKDMWEYTNILNGEKITESEQRIQNVTIRQGPNKLILINVKKDLKNVEKEMAFLDKQPNHIYEAQYNKEVRSYYSKKQAISDMNTEKVMRLIVNVLVIIILLIAYSFFVFIKIVSEMDEKKRQMRFLRIMGMPGKERVRVLKNELSRTFWMNVIILSISTICFTIMTFKARLYGYDLIKLYLHQAVWIWGIWIGLEFLFIKILGVLVVHKVEEK